jgi:hypothetical protein
MKFATAATLFTLPLAVAAFCPSTGSSSSVRNHGPLSVVVTGPAGKAAKSAEEDLALTLKIIMDHQDRSTTVSKEQFIQQMEAVAKVPEVPVEPVDVSVPYNAAAKLAYEASDKSIPFEKFEPKYLAEAIALVKSKRPVDISVPYNAAAKLAYEASDKSLSFAEFEPKYLAEAVALVKSKRPVDISVPYNAAAKLAYEASDKSISFAEFEPKYLAEAVALVKSKRPVDISVPYNAAAKLAYEASDKSLSFAEFEPKYLAEAVELVKSKQKK